MRGVAVGALRLTALAVCEQRRQPRTRGSAPLLGCVSIGAWMITESPLDVERVRRRPCRSWSWRSRSPASFWLFVADRLRGPAASPVDPGAGRRPAGCPALRCSSCPADERPDLGGRATPSAACLRCTPAYIDRARLARRPVESRRRLRGIDPRLCSAVLGLRGDRQRWSTGCDPKGAVACCWRSGEPLRRGHRGAASSCPAPCCSCRARPSLFGPRAPGRGRADARAEAADRQLLAKLEAFMADGGWTHRGPDDRRGRPGAGDARAPPAPADQPASSAIATSPTS